jgi:hypothetical protein
MSVKYFELLVAYKEVGRPVSNDDLRDAFHDAAYDMAYFEPVADDDGEIDHLGYQEDLARSEWSASESILNTVSPEIKSILLHHDIR